MLHCVDALLSSIGIKAASTWAAQGKHTSLIATVAAGQISFISSRQKSAGAEATVANAAFLQIVTNTEERTNQFVL